MNTLGLIRSWWWFPRSQLCLVGHDSSCQPFCFTFSQSPQQKACRLLTLASPVPGQWSCVPRPRQDMYAKKSIRRKNNSYLKDLPSGSSYGAHTSYDPENPRSHGKHHTPLPTFELISSHGGKIWSCCFCHFSGEIFRWEAFSNHSSVFSQPEA